MDSLSTFDLAERRSIRDENLVRRSKRVTQQRAQEVNQGGGKMITLFTTAKPFRGHERNHRAQRSEELEAPPFLTLK